MMVGKVGGDGGGGDFFLGWFSGLTLGAEL